MGDDLKFRFIFIILFCLGIFSCGEERHELIGEWHATWKADPSGYPDSLDADKYRMKGIWTFNSDQTMSILAYGCEDCIFGSDTLYHSQRWEIKNDTVFLINEQNIEGLICKIVSEEENHIRLQLLSDMYVDLEK